MNQRKGKSGSHRAHVPTNILVMDSVKVACRHTAVYLKSCVLQV